MNKIIAVSSIALMLCSMAVANDAGKASVAEASSPLLATDLSGKLYRLRLIDALARN